MAARAEAGPIVSALLVPPSVISVSSVVNHI